MSSMEQQRTPATPDAKPAMPEARPTVRRLVVDVMGMSRTGEAYMYFSKGTGLYPGLPVDRRGELDADLYLLPLRSWE